MPNFDPLENDELRPDFPRNSSQNPNAPLLDAIVKERIKHPANAPDFTPSQPVNEFDAIVSESLARSNKEGQLNRALSASITENPDERAKYMRLSEQTGLDPEMLASDATIRQDAEQKLKLNNINMGDLLGTHPVTASFLSDIDNAAVAHDDIKNLTDREQDYRVISDTLKAFTTKPVGSVIAGIVTDTIASLFGMSATLAGKAGENPVNIVKPVTSLAELASGQKLTEFELPSLPALLAHVMGTQLPRPTVNEEKYLLGQQRAFRALSDKIAGTTGTEGPFASSVYSGLRSLGSSVPALALGFINPAITLSLMALETGGTTYGEARRKGLGADTALSYAWNDTLAEFWTEMIPVTFALQPGIFRQNLLKNFINFQIREGSTEQVATIWQDFNKWVYASPNATFSDYLAERPSAALSTAIAATVSGMGQTGAIMTIDHVLTRGATETTKAYFDALANGVKESKLHERLPEKTQEFISKITESGDIKNVYINADQFKTYFQSQNLDAAAAATEILGEDGAKQLNSALATGGDLVIPLGVYAEKVAGSDHQAGLAQDLRLRQEDLSPHELQQRTQTQQESTEELNHIIEQSRGEIDKATPVDTIYNEVYAEAVNSGASPSQAVTWATLESARYRVRGERLGIDPLQLWEQEGGLQITRPGTSPTAPEGVTTFNQGENEASLGKTELGPGFRRITLLENANLSTFIHEIGHTWLEELKSDTLNAQAPDQLKKDFNIIAEQYGIQPDETITTESHEKFAKSIELYFREGRPPSPTLREVFHRIKAWMLHVYRTIRGMGVSLNDDVRGVFDRMLALDAEIEQAHALYTYVPLFSTPEQAGMTEGEFKVYTEATQSTRSEAEDKLIESTFRQLTREQSREWRDNRKIVSDEVQKEALKDPVYSIMSALATGTLSIPGVEGNKLSKQGIVAAMEDASILPSLSPAKLGMKGWIYSAKEGVHPDTVASEYGFPSGKSMLHALATATPWSQHITDTTDKAMLTRYGNPLDPGELRLKAEQLVHSEQQGELLHMELQALRRKKAEIDKITGKIEAAERLGLRKSQAQLNAPIPIATLKEVAYNEVADTIAGKLNPNAYLLAEQRTGRAAIAAAAKGDYGAAADAKQQQILNFYLYKEALATKREADARVRHAYGLTRKTARAKIGLAGQEWLVQMDSILGAYSFATLPKTANPRTLVEWAKSVEESTGEKIAIAPSVLDESKRINHKELTINELRAVTDSLMSIEHVAQKIMQVKRGDAAISFKEATETLAAAVREHIIPHKLPITNADLTQGQRIAQSTQGFFNTNWRPEKLFELMDGGQSGIWHDLFWQPSVDAQVKRDDLQQALTNTLTDFYTSAPKNYLESMGDALDIESMQQAISRRTAIGMALNSGNASNRMKLQKGGIWFGDTHMQLSDDQLNEVLGRLNSTDWRLITTLWQTVGELYAPLDDLNRRAVGLPLKAIEPMQIATKFGVFPGGYWPAVGDPRHTKVGELQENSEGVTLSDIFTPRYPKAATSHSFREERTGAFYPLQLDWRRVLANHVSKATTDIAYHEWVKQSRRLLENQSVKKAIQNTLGEDIYRAHMEWLIHQVAPLTGGYSATQSIDTVMNAAMRNVAVAALGFKAATSIANFVTAPILASHQIKTSYILRGMSKYLSNPTKATEAVYAISGEMRYRHKHYEQTFNGVLDKIADRTDFRANIIRWAMGIHLYMDKITSVALWAGKYQQGIDEGLAPDESIRLADKMIRTTQTSAAPKDLSAFERDPRYRMFKLFIGPQMIMQNELRGAVFGKSFGQALSDPKIWGVMLADWIIPALLYDLAAGRGPEEDEEEWRWALRKILLYPAETVPFIRDMGHALESAVTGREPFTRTNPITDVGMTAIKSAAKALSDNADMKDYTVAMTRALGPLMGLPSNQAVTVEEYLFDVAEGEYPATDLHRLIYKEANK